MNTTNETNINQVEHSAISDDGGMRNGLKGLTSSLNTPRTDLNYEEEFNALVESTYGSCPEDIIDSSEICNGPLFIKELQELCIKHNMTLFAGALGIRFIPRDSEGKNIEDDGLAGVYWTQSFGNKEFIPVR